jgi:MFS family permease
MLNRFFLGFLESAVAPAFTVLVTFWWTREEQALRTGLWYSCVGVATTVSPLINYGLGQIHSSLTTWKPLFLVLGSVTVVWSFVLFFCLPDSPLTTKGLTEDERAIAIRRLERNNAGTISRTFNKAQFFEAFRDFKLYSCTLIILLTGVPSGAIGTFGTIVINGFGFSHFDSLALTCPIGAITALSILLAGYVTRKLSNVRYLLIVIYALISVAGTIICWVGPRSDRGLLFAGIFLMAVQVAAGGLAVSLAASNVAGHTSKYIKVVTYEHSLIPSRKSNDKCNDLRGVLRWKCNWSRDLRLFSWAIVSRWVCGQLHLSVPCSRYWRCYLRCAAKRKRKAGPNDWRPLGFAHH